MVVSRPVCSRQLNHVNNIGATNDFFDHQRIYLVKFIPSWFMRMSFDTKKVWYFPPHFDFLSIFWYIYCSFAAALILVNHQRWDCIIRGKGYHCLPHLLNTHFSRKKSIFQEMVQVWSTSCGRCQTLASHSWLQLTFAAGHALPHSWVGRSQYMVQSQELRDKTTVRLRYCVL